MFLIIIFRTFDLNQIKYIMKPQLKLATTVNPDGSGMSHKGNRFDPRRKAVFNGSEYIIPVMENRFKKHRTLVEEATTIISLGAKKAATR